MNSKWVELGRAVKAARHRTGLGDMKEWAERVDRTSRTLLGLERGEKTGDGTLTAVEAALGWPVGWSHRILNGEVEGLPPHAAPPNAPVPAEKDDPVWRVLQMLRTDLDEMSEKTEKIREKVHSAEQMLIERSEERSR